MAMLVPGGMTYTRSRFNGHPLRDFDHGHTADARKDRGKMAFLLGVKVAYQEQSEPRAGGQGIEQLGVSLETAGRCPHADDQKRQAVRFLDFRVRRAGIGLRHGNGPWAEERKSKDVESRPSASPVAIRLCASTRRLRLSCFIIRNPMCVHSPHQQPLRDRHAVSLCRSSLHFLIKPRG